MVDYANTSKIVLLMSTHNFMIILFYETLFVITKLLAILAFNNNCINQIKYIYRKKDLGPSIQK